MTEALPEDVRRFVLDHVDSIAEMEALVMLVREPARAWPIDQVVARLYISPDDAEATLERLRAAGLAERAADGWRVAVVAEPRAGTLVRLVALYATHLIPITNLIHAKGSRIRRFADAFQLRKKD